MCGIGGIVTFDGSEPPRAELKRIADALAHRGPDAEGYFSQAGVPGIGLAHRRLSIVDLSHEADHPVTGEDKTIQALLNGEVYNYLELRDGLEGRHTFRTQGDTEPVVHGYEERGDAIFAALDGMFALALWDGRQRRLVLARDPFGKKPLYYWHDAHRFVFASEIKGLLAVGVPVSLNEQRLAFGRELQVPVGPWRVDAVLVHDEDRRRRDSADAREQRLRGGHVAKAQVLAEALLVEAYGHTHREQPLDLGGKDEALGVVPVIERLLAEGIAGEDEPPCAAIPQREREHPVQLSDDRVAAFLVPVDEGLGVALGAEGVPPLQPSTQLAVVVDLAVEHGLDRLVLAGDGMVGLVREIDDGEPAVGEADPGYAALREIAFGVGPAVGERVRDALQVRARRLAAVEGHDPADAAHQGSSRNKCVQIGIVIP